MRKPILSIAVATAIALSACVAAAQETTTQTTMPKSVRGTVTLDTAQVVYASGDDVVLKTADGRLRLLDLPPGTSLTVDGKPAKVSDLTAGSTVTNLKAKTRVESEVTTVTQINGTVTSKSGPFVTLRLDDGTSKIYRVPNHATFTVDGREAKYADLTKNMKISATVVKTEGLSTISNKAAMVGQTPPQVGVLLIER